MPKFRKNFPEYNDMSEKELSNRMYVRAGIILPAPPVPWRLVRFAVYLALGAPLAALVLGSAFGWVFAGFKNKAR